MTDAPPAETPAPPDLGFTVTLDAFTGPLDLLLYLVRKADVDITDIPIALIADQFAAIVAATERVDLEQAGDFIVWAATLLEIKARAVVPPDEPAARSHDPDEILDPRADLVRRLLEYRTFKEASFLLVECEQQWRGRHERRLRELIPDDGAAAEALDLGEIDTWTLCRTWEDILQRINGMAPRTVVVDDMPMERRLQLVLEAIRARGEGTLDELFAVETSRLVRTSIVLALLEGARQRFIEVRQDEQFGTIRFRLRADEERAQPDGPRPDPEPLPRLRKALPLVTYTSVAGGGGDDEDDDGPVIESEDQRFARELEEQTRVDTLLRLAADVDGAYIAWIEQEKPHLLEKVRPPPPPEPAPPVAPEPAVAMATAPPSALAPPDRPATSSAEPVRPATDALPAPAAESAVDAAASAPPGVVVAAADAPDAGDVVPPAPAGALPPEDGAEAPLDAVAVPADPAGHPPDAMALVAPDAPAAQAPAVPPAAGPMASADAPAASPEDPGVVDAIGGGSASPGAERPVEPEPDPMVAIPPDAGTPAMPESQVEIPSPAIAEGPVPDPPASGAEDGGAVCDPPRPVESAPSAPDPVPASEVPAEPPGGDGPAGQADDGAPPLDPTVDAGIGTPDVGEDVQPPGAVVGSHPDATAPAPSPAGGIHPDAGPVVDPAPADPGPARAPAPATAMAAAMPGTVPDAEPRLPDHPVVADAGIPSPPATAADPPPSGPPMPAAVGMDAGAPGDPAVASSPVAGAAEPPADDPALPPPPSSAEAAPAAMPPAPELDPTDHAPVTIAIGLRALTDPVPAAEPSPEAADSDHLPEPLVDTIADPEPHEAGHTTEPLVSIRPPSSESPDDMLRLRHLKPLAAWLVLGNAVAWGSYAAWAHRPAEVLILHAPATVAGAQPLTVTFNLPVWTAAPAVPPDLGIEPAVTGAWTWLTATQARFAPSDPWPLGITLRVRAGALATADGFRPAAGGGEVAVQVAAPAPAAIRLLRTGAMADWELSFPVAVDPVSVLRSLRVDGRRAVALSGGDPTTVRIRAPAAAPTARMELLAPFAWSAEVPAMARQGVSAAQARATVDGGSILVATDLPADAALAAGIRTEPPVPASARVVPGGIELRGPFRPGSAYTVQVPGRPVADDPAAGVRPATLAVQVPAAAPAVVVDATGPGRLHIRASGADRLRLRWRDTRVPPWLQAFPRRFDIAVADGAAELDLAAVDLPEGEIDAVVDALSGDRVVASAPLRLSTRLIGAARLSAPVPVPSPRPR